MLLLNEVIEYQKNVQSRLASSLEIKQQGNNNLSNYHLHNYTYTDVLVQQEDIFGRIFIGSSDKIIINPCGRTKEEMTAILDKLLFANEHTATYSLISSVANILESQQFLYKNCNGKIKHSK